MINPYFIISAIIFTIFLIWLVLAARKDAQRLNQKGGKK